MPQEIPPENFPIPYSQRIIGYHLPPRNLGYCQRPPIFYLIIH